MAISKTIDAHGRRRKTNVGSMAAGWAFTVVLGNVFENVAGMDLPNELQFKQNRILGLTHLVVAAE